jgi:hypothetical protein
LASHSIFLDKLAKHAFGSGFRAEGDDDPQKDKKQKEHADPFEYSGKPYGCNADLASFSVAQRLFHLRLRSDGCLSDVQATGFKPIRVRFPFPFNI